jgi:ubiquinone/menaquinone biosynthesis C-methylase UbiE
MYSTEHENTVFARTLCTYLKPIFKAESPNILNVGCGKCPEAEIVLDSLGGRMTGIDIKEADIEMLRARYKNNHQLRFISADASNLREKVSHAFDIVLARHPEPDTNWHHIFSECYKTTKEEGILLATCYNLPDFVFTKRNVIKSGYRILHSSENSEVEYLSTALKVATDGHVIVASKCRRSLKEVLYAAFIADAVFLNDMRKSVPF